MTAKEYLMQVKIIEARVKSTDAEIEALRLEEVSVRSTWPDGQPGKSGTGDPVGTTATKLADQLTILEEKQLKTRAQLWQKRTEIVETIGKIQDADCNRLLYLRYIEGRKWEEIAIELGYTFQWVCGALHGRALQKIKEIINT